MKPADVKRALLRDVAEAALTLTGRELPDEAIHATRKKLKSARAKLRLLRTAIARSVYARENAALRDAARPLSGVRDSRAMLDTVNALLARKGSNTRRLLLTALRGRLRETHRAARARFETEKRAAASAVAIEREADRIEKWNVGKSDRYALSASIRRIYRSARKALAAAEADRSPESLHELRKRVKYLREALAPLDRAARVVKRADKVASELGEDHDLYVLQQSLAATEASLQARSDAFAEELAKLRGELARRALKRGGKLLRRSPRAFVKRLALDRG